MNKKPLVKLEDFNKNLLGGPSVAPTREQIIENTPNTLLLLGNGMISNGWEPYRSHLEQVKEYRFGEQISQEISSIPDPSLFLSRHSYSQRSLKSNLFNASFTGNHLELIARAINEKNTITADFSSQYEFASRLRETLNGHKYKIKDSNICEFLNDGMVAVITTNWDDLYYEHPELGKNIVQLHGICHRPETLILPTQFIVDDKVLWDTIPYFSHKPDYNEKKLNLVKNVLRPVEVVEEQLIAQRIAGRWFQYAENIVVAGLAFNSYDSELLSTICTNVRARQTKKLTIINPCPLDRKNIAMAFGVFNSSSSIVVNEIDPTT